MDADLLDGARSPRLVALTDLGRELLGWLTGRAPIEPDDPVATAALEVLRAVLRPVTLAAVPVSMPGSPRLRALARAVQARPGDGWTPDRMAAELGVARRTLERRWRAETGSSPAAWCTRARLLAAAALLVSGRPVGEVAAATGWSSPSAFTAAFGREVGTTRTAYVTLGRGHPADAPAGGARRRDDRRDQRDQGPT